LGWAFLGGGLGGAAACLLIMGLAWPISQIAGSGLVMTVPLVEGLSFGLEDWLKAFLVGLGIGGGLTGGWELGRRLWRRLQLGG